MGVLLTLIVSAIAVAVVVQLASVALAVRMLHVEADRRRILQLGLLLSLCGVLGYAGSNRLPAVVPLGLVQLAVILGSVWAVKAVLAVRLRRAIGIWLVTLLIGLALAVGAALALRGIVVTPFKVTGDAMVPTMVSGDQVLVGKWLYHVRAPRRWEVVAFRYPADRRRPFLKRVVGLPGESVEIREGAILINGKRVEPPGMLKTLQWLNQGPYGQAGQPVSIPADAYFVLGDNSRVSHDSRFWGLVSKRDLIGKALCIFSPVNRLGDVN